MIQGQKGFCPDQDQVIHIDLETTDKYDWKNPSLPWIIQFSARSLNNELFNTMITPCDSSFCISDEAKKIHGWSKEDLLKILKKFRPHIDQAWKMFENWLKKI